MSENHQEKVDIINRIESKISNAKSVIVWNYQGISVQKFAKIRDEMKENNIENIVYKNTLAKIAFKRKGFEKLVDNLVGQNSYAFSLNDEIAPARIIGKFLKSMPTIKFNVGIIENEVVSGEQLDIISKIESKEMLLSKFLFCVQAPMSKLAATLESVSKQIKE